MKAVIALAALGSAALAAAQSCTSNHPGVFSFQTQNITNKRSVDDSLVERQAGATACGSYITIRLNDGVLSDGFNPPRIGNIVNNFQFQFDGPIQDNAYFDKGFQICDGKIAVGTDTTFYQCLSGGFYNIYYGFGQDQQQCNPVVLSTFDCVPASNVPSGAQTSFPIKTGPIPGKTGLKLPSGSSSPVTSAASSAASSSSKASSSAPITSSAVISSVVSSAVSSAKYPVGNTTVIAPTGTGVTPVTSTPGSGSKTTSTSARASFTGAANMLAAGQKLVGAVAGVAAFAMF